MSWSKGQCRQICNVDNFLITGVSLNDFFVSPVKTLQVILEIGSVVNGHFVTRSSLEPGSSVYDDELPVLVILDPGHHHHLLFLLPDPGHGDGVILNGQVSCVESNVGGRLVGENLVKNKWVLSHPQV